MKPEQKSRFLRTIWVKHNDEVPALPWLSLSELPGEGKYLLCEPGRKGDTGVKEVIIPADLLGDEVLSMLPLAAALGVLTELNACLGESLLIVGDSPWSRIFSWSGELLSLFPITWVTEEKEKGSREESKSPTCRLLTAGSIGTIDRIKVITSNQGYALVVETTGHKRLLEMALGAARVEGRIALIGPSPGIVPLDLHNTVHYKELTAKGFWDSLPSLASLESGIKNGVLRLIKDRLPEEITFIHSRVDDINQLREKKPGFIIVSGRVK